MAKYPLVTRVLITTTLFLTVALGTVAYQQYIGEPRSAEAERRAQSAANDEEWLAIIERVKQRRSDPNTPWPEPRLPAGAKVIRSCVDLPLDAVRTEGSDERSPDGGRRRLIEFYRDPAARQAFILILYSDGDLSGCSAELKAWLQGPDLYRENVDKHICEQMRVMAQGSPKTDPTLRDASPRVAQAYLEAFCQ